MEEQSKRLVPKRPSPYVGNFRELPEERERRLALEASGRAPKPRRPNPYLRGWR